MVALTHQAFDQVASAFMLTTFFAGIDPRWVDIFPAPFALAIVLLTRGRLGYRGEQPAHVTQSLPSPAAAIGA